MFMRIDENQGVQWQFLFLFECVFLRALFLVALRVLFPSMRVLFFLSLALFLVPFLCPCLFRRRVCWILHDGHLLSWIYLVV